MVTTKIPSMEERVLPSRDHTFFVLPDKSIFNAQSQLIVTHYVLCYVVVPESDILQGWTVFKLLVQKFGRLTERVVHLINKFIKVA